MRRGRRGEAVARAYPTADVCFDSIFNCSLGDPLAAGHSELTTVSNVSRNHEERIPRDSIARRKRGVLEGAENAREAFPRTRWDKDMDKDGLQREVGIAVQSSRNASFIRRRAISLVLKSDI